MKSGTERCFMAHPSGKYTLWTMGRQNIDAKLKGGWTIVDSDRNHLKDAKEETAAKPEQVEIPLDVQRKRPRISKSHK